MSTISQRDFILPVIFVSATELEINIDYKQINKISNYSGNNKNIDGKFNYLDNRVGLSEKEFNYIKNKTRKVIEYKYFQIRDSIEGLSLKEKLETYVDIFIQIFSVYQKSNTKLNYTNDKNIDEATYNRLLKLYIDKFREIYKLHLAMFRFDEIEGKGINIDNTSRTLGRHLLTTNIEFTINEIINDLIKLNENQRIQIYEAIVETWINLEINNTKNLNNISKNGLNGIEVNELVTIHINKLRETYKMISSFYN